MILDTTLCSFATNFVPVRYMRQVALAAWIGIALVPSALIAQSPWEKIKRQAKDIQRQIDPLPQASASPQPGSETSTTGRSSASNPQNIHVKDPTTDLWLAANRGDAQGCENAIARGADISRISLSQEVDAPNTTNLSIVRCLVEHGADVNARRGTQDHPGPSPLEVVASRGYEDIAAYLLEKGANPNDNTNNSARPDRNSSLLLTAATHADLEMVNVLLTHGADATPPYHFTVLSQPASLLDAVMVYMSGAVQNNLQPTLVTQNKVDAMCEIVRLLEAHGARRTAASASLKGEEQCNRSAAQKQQTVVALERQQTASDKQQTFNDRVIARETCVNVLAGFYNCSCFADKIMQYRTEHPLREPVANTLQKVDVHTCVGPPAAMAEWGYNHSLIILQSDRHDPTEKEAIAHCAGEGLATIFQQSPTTSIKVINSDLTNALVKCNR